jgi:O-antigen ligase
MAKNILSSFQPYIKKAWIVGFLVLLGFYVSEMMIQGSLFRASLPVLIVFLIAITILFLNYPKLLYLSALLIGHFMAYLSRVFPGPTYGLAIDFLLAIGFVVLLSGRSEISFKHIKKPEFIALFLWILYVCLLILNPNSPGPIAWFYAMRSYCLYLILVPIVVCGFITSTKDIKTLFNILIALSVYCTLIGLRQEFIGLYDYEMDWLNRGAMGTHLVNGRLREFSIFTDASNYGGYCGFMCVVAAIYGCLPNRLPGRFLYFAIALLNFYGLMLSGSRGPVAIVGIGGIVFLMMIRKSRLTFIGSILGLSGYIFLKFSTLLNSNYNIYRLRTAFDPNDASLLVRKAKEEVLSQYMADKPFGGGVGSAGNWGERFAPGTFLADTPTDGVFSRIWMETGIVGLVLFIALLIFLVVRIGYRLWGLPECRIRQILLGLYAGYCGLIFSSYVSENMTQVPLSIVVYALPALIIVTEYWYKTGVDIKDPPMAPRPPLY